MATRTENARCRGAGPRQRDAGKIGARDREHQARSPQQQPQRRFIRVAELRGFQRQPGSRSN